MAACTLRRSGSLTGTDPVITCDTVPTATPARSATSLIVTMNQPDWFAPAPRAKDLHILQPDIPRFDLHRARRHVQLDADQPRHLAARAIVVDELAHDATVDHLHDRVAAEDDA